MYQKTRNVSHFLSQGIYGTLLVCLASAPTLAQVPGPDIPPKIPSVPKWSQRPVDQFGENVPSDIDWRQLMDPPTAPPFAPNWVVADDFISDGRPITSVRWWGSYFSTAAQPVFNQDTGMFDAVIEEGYVISFHEDIPDPDGPTGPGFSMPGALLGTYIAPEFAVYKRPTEYIGWDQHPVWEYVVDLEWTHLEHAIPGLSEPDAFLETAGTIYWISITAENGHEVFINPNDPSDWQFIPTQDPVEEEHFWGWHTSPERFNDVPVDGNIAMNGPDWIYGPWNPINTFHGEGDMAFELLTPIPEPASLGLIIAGSAVMSMARRRWDS